MFPFRKAFAVSTALVALVAAVQPARAAKDPASPEAQRSGAAAVRVSTQDELEAALRDLRGGGAILLSGGTYAKLEMNARNGGGGRDSSGKVTIASADPADPAVVNRMTLRGAANVEIRGVTFDRAASETDRTPFVIQGARGVTLEDVVFEGEIVDGFGVGVGLLVLGSKDVALIDSELSDFRNGLRIADVEALTVRGNDFSGMSNDSMILGGIDGARIEGNDFHDQKSPAELRHKDSIQFHTENGTSRDIVIRDNRIVNPEVSHSIFFGNSMARAGDLEAYYTDIVIENNFIRGAHAHGITVEHGLRVRIENNTLLQNPDLGYTEPVNVPLINVSSLSRDVTIRGNRVASVPEAQNATWDVSGNVTGGKSLRHWYGDYPPAGGRDRRNGGERAGEDADPGPPSVARR